MLLSCVTFRHLRNVLAGQRNIRHKDVQTFSTIRGAAMNQRSTRHGPDKWIGGCALLLALAVNFTARAADPTATAFSVAPLLPPETIAVISMPDGKKSLERLEKTGLYQILVNADIQSAFKSLKQKWQLGQMLFETQAQLKVKDIIGYTTQGEVTIAVITVDKDGENGEPVPDLFFAVQAGDKAAQLLDELNHRFDQLQQQVGGVLEITNNLVGDNNIKSIRVPNNPLNVHYGVCEGTVLFAMGEGHIEKVLALRDKAKAMGGKLPIDAAPQTLGQVPAFRKVMDQTGELSDLLAYVNLEQIRNNDRIKQQLPPTGTGLDQVRSVAYALGLRDKGIREAIYVDLPPGARNGILGLLDSATVEKDLLSVAPRSCMMAAAVKVAPEKVFDSLVEMASLENPDAKAEAEAWLAKTQQQLNIDLRKEVFGALNGQVTFMVNIAGKHPKFPIGFPSPILSIGIKDGQAAKTALSAMLKAAQNDFDMTLLTEGNKEIYCLRAKHGELNKVPICYAIDNTDIIVGIYPLAIREELQRRAQAATNTQLALTEDSDYKATRAKISGNPKAIMFADLGALAIAAYDIAIPLAQITPKRNNEVEVDRLPTSDFLAQNLGPAIFSLNTDGDGIVAEAFSSTGGLSVLALALPQAIREQMRGRRERAVERRQDTLNIVANALKAYAVDNAGAFPATLKDLQPKYLGEAFTGLDKIQYRGKQDASNKVVADTEKLAGPITVLLQDGTIAKVPRERFGNVLKQGFNAATDNAAAGGRPPAESPPRPPEGNF
jgi:hypothetical protein